MSEVPCGAGNDVRGGQDGHRGALYVCQSVSHPLAFLIHEPLIPVTAVSHSELVRANHSLSLTSSYFTHPLITPLPPGGQSTTSEEAKSVIGGHTGLLGLLLDLIGGSVDGAEAARGQVEPYTLNTKL